MTKDHDPLSPKMRVGLDLVSELMGPDIQANLRGQLQSDAFGADMMRRGLEQTFGDVWLRPGLNPAERSLVTLGVLIAARAEHEIFHHVGIALHNGLTSAQIEEVIIQASPYVGLIASQAASAAAKRAIDEHAGKASPAK